MKTLSCLLIFFCLLAYSCKSSKSTRTAGRFKQTIIVRNNGTIRHDKRIIRDTVDHYIIRKIKSKDQTRGTYSYTIRSKTISYNKHHKIIKKTVFINRHQQNQGNRTIYYYKNHDRDTMKKLEELENTLSMKIAGNH